VKFDANVFIGDRYMAILRLCQFGCEMPIFAHFGDVFLWFYPLNVVGYCRDPKRHILGQKRAFCTLWRIDRRDRPRNVTWARAEESKKKEMKKRNSEL